jgi:hypothetical protein
MARWRARTVELEHCLEQGHLYKDRQSRDDRYELGSCFRMVNVNMNVNVTGRMAAQQPRYLATELQ